MEYLDLYDENRKPVGEKILRGSGKPEKGKYINIVIVFIENSEGKFLIQMTSKEKGSIWATTGGLVKSGSNPDLTITEEIKEELGLDVDIKELKLINTQKRERAFQDTYYLKKDINIKDLKLQKEEVEYVRWFSIDEIKKLISENKFREGNILGFEKVLEMKKGDIMTNTKHLGAYGLIIENHSIVLIKKVGGPYDGLLDLPGGTIEHGETPKEALVREMKEEVGIDIIDYNLIDANSVNVKWMHNDNLECCHHIGIFYIVNSYKNEIKENVKIDDKNDDSLGAKFYDITKLRKSMLSKIAILELEKLGYKLND